MKHYTELLKIGIPVPKTDLMYEPQKRWNGMENWGLFLFKPESLMIGESEGEQYRFDLVRLVTHEMAHSWFGNLVTCTWWNFLWINEGLTNFMSYVGIAHMEPGLKPWERFYVREMQMAMYRDGNMTDHLPPHTSLSGRANHSPA